jgi:hypothetical protein
MSALTQLVRRINAKRNAERANAQRCVVVVVSTRRVASVSEPNSHSYRAANVMTCFHDISYTMPCTKCRRTRSDAERYLTQLKRKLSIA